MGSHYSMVLVYVWSCVNCDSRSRGGFLDPKKCIKSAIRHMKKFSCGPVEITCLRRKVVLVDD